MAQRTEKEETEFKVLETLTTTTTLTLCSNNCGVTANPSTNNMCQKCFNASVAAAAGVDPNPISKKSSRSVNLRSTPARVVIRPREIDPVKRDQQQTINRCSGCRKKVGLTGFRCRCGDLSAPSTVTQIATIAATTTKPPAARRSLGESGGQGGEDGEIELIFRSEKGIFNRGGSKASIKIGENR
ncbi:hypothetical protein Bca52824_041490 [Brassica carinata]|uniref:A20-type domain-containing protein n=1 Tax=Brassica carinata TaxID=52824 RepID=A0A8X7RVA3_BRACI|nr:hypothetical protein Bca52824_041490 [Brassica carinata]